MLMLTLHSFSGTRSCGPFDHDRMGLRVDQYRPRSRQRGAVCCRVSRPEIINNPCAFHPRHLPTPLSLTHMHAQGWRINPGGLLPRPCLGPRSGFRCVNLHHRPFPSQYARLTLTGCTFSQTTGPGQSYAAATGLYYKILSTFASFALSTIFCGVGGSLYIGAGSMKYVQVARTSNSITAATVRDFEPSVTYHKYDQNTHLFVLSRPPFPQKSTELAAPSSTGAVA
jgi:hypothetical protein